MTASAEQKGWSRRLQEMRRGLTSPEQIPEKPTLRWVIAQVIEECQPVRNGLPSYSKGFAFS
jgi:hypothetical protein